MKHPPDHIRTEIAEFDKEAETKVTEATLRNLIDTFPENKKIEHVLVKVLAINTLYRARVLDVDIQRMAEHIVEFTLDEQFKKGDPEVVELIWRCYGARKNYYSFATKYCSWHNHEEYSIYDGNVDAALWAYKKQSGTLKYKREDVGDYPKFVGIVKKFREIYQLDGYSLKQIDKFLWRVGGEVLANREKPSPLSLREFEQAAMDVISARQRCQRTARARVPEVIAPFFNSSHGHTGTPGNFMGQVGNPDTVETESWESRRAAPEEPRF